mgnify:FL=1
MSLDWKQFKRWIYLMVNVLYLAGIFNSLLAESIALPDQNPGNQLPKSAPPSSSSVNSSVDKLFKLLQQEHHHIQDIFGDEFEKSFGEMERFFKSPQGQGFEQLFKQLNQKRGVDKNRTSNWQEYDDHWELKVTVDREYYSKFDVIIENEAVTITGSSKSGKSNSGYFRQTLSLPGNVAVDRAKISQKEQEIIIIFPKKMIELKRALPSKKRKPKIPSRRTPLVIEGVTI